MAGRGEAGDGGYQGRPSESHVPLGALVAQRVARTGHALLKKVRLPSRRCSRGSTEAGPPDGREQIRWASDRELLDTTLDNGFTHSEIRDLAEFDIQGYGSMAKSALGRCG